MKWYTLKLSRIVCGTFPMAEKKTTINLLPQSSGSFMTQFFNWALSIGRLLIILTETIALVTFVYRFSLDMQLVNFHDKITDESVILDNFQSAENTFVDIQDRLATVQQYSAISTRTIDIFSAITKMGQGNVTFNDLTVNTQDAIIEIQAPSATTLSQFVNKLKAYPLVTSVSIDKVENNPGSAQIIVLITATLKQAPYAQTEQQVANSLDQAASSGQ